MRRIHTATAQDYVIVGLRMFAVTKPQGLADRVHARTRAKSNWPSADRAARSHNRVIINQH